MDEIKSKICFICTESNSVFEYLNKKINDAKNIKEKADLAQALINKVNIAIEQHKDKNSPCIEILKLRKQTAEVIIKAQKLI